MKHEINGFFNPQRQGDTFKGLNGSLDGSVADRIIQDLPTFLKEAGRDYYIKRVPAPHPSYTDTDTGLALPIGGVFWLVRSDNNAIVSPKTVTEQYAPITLGDIGAELQPWCDQGWATPDGVYGGRFLPDGGESLEVLSLRLDGGDMDNPENERLVHYLIVTNPHGQGGKAQGKIITWRIVCCNTFAAAVSASYDFAISHRCGKEADHQTIMAKRMEEAVENWSEARAKISELAARINVWQDTKVSQDDASDLTRTLLGIGGKDLDDLKTRTRNTYDAIMGGFANRDAGTVGQSAWDFINAVTFYTSSPSSPMAKKSKVQPIDRMVRNIDPNGTGFALERKAERLIAELI